MNDSRKRYIGLDVHKHYLIALGVDALGVGKDLTSIPWGSKKPIPLAALEINRKALS